jgi:hypothetical protein
MVEEHLAPRLVFQECQTSHIPDNDHSEPLSMALQGQKNPLCRQVSLRSEKTYIL